jgi:hypothetical protein
MRLQYEQGRQATKIIRSSKCWLALWAGIRRFWLLTAVLAVLYAVVPCHFGRGGHLGVPHRYRRRSVVQQS